MTTTVLCHGTFDFPHYGHLVFLKAARQIGDRLIVSLTSDKYVKKGPGRPVVKDYERFAIISEWKCVDFVQYVHEETGMTAIRMFKPEIYCKGQDYRTEDKLGHLKKEKELVESYGGRLVILDVPSMYGATQLIQRIHNACKDS